MSSANAQMQLVKERLFQQRRSHFGEDVCDLIGPVFTEGGSAGDSVVLSTIVSGLDCFVKEISGANAQTVIGGEAFVSSHQIELLKTATTQAITPEYRIKVHPRDGMGERVFEKTVNVSQSFSPLIVLKATLVRQGYQ